MNSLRVILDPCKSPGIMCAKVWIRDGSRSDPSNKKGIHNVLGSLMTRGCGPYDNLELGDLVEGAGAVLTSETYEDGFMLSLKCTQQHIPTLLPVLIYMVTEPKCEQNQLNLEKQLSIQAINMQKENPFYIALNAWKKNAYCNHPYSHDVYGHKSHIQNLTRDDLLTLSENISRRFKTFVLSGSLPNNIEDYFSIINEPSNSYNQDTSLYSRSFTKYRLNEVNSLSVHNENLNQVIFILGKPTIPYSHDDSICLNIINSHLGYGMTSLLFKELREENGLSYDVGTYYPVRELESPFIIHASSTEEKAKRTLKIIKRCWDDMHNKPLSEEQLKLAKTKLLSNIAHNSQTISQRAERRAHLTGINIPDDHGIELVEKINAVTSNEINIAATNHLQNPTLSMIGPEDTIKDLTLLWNSLN